MHDYELILVAAREALEQNKPQEALKILDNQVLTDYGEAIFLRGEIFFKLQRWGEALNQFYRYLESFPSDTKAESYCRMIQDILNFYHKDLYNP